MSIPGWQAFIRDKAQEQKVKWTRHAVNALGAETVSVGNVEIALQQAEIYEPTEKEWHNDWRTRK